MIVVVIAVIALALGATIGYSISSERTTTYTVTDCTSEHCALVITSGGSPSTTSTHSTSTTNSSLFDGLTTYTTVTRTTLTFGGSTYLTTTGEYSGCIPPVQCYPTTVTTEIATNQSGSCYYVLPQAVPCLIGQNFTLSVNYTGQWEVFYQGWNCIGKDCGAMTTNGSYTGDGFSSGTITVQGSDNGWTLCAQAKKLDTSSSSAITLTIGGAVNSTTLALGSVSACDETLLV